MQEDVVKCIQNVGVLGKWMEGNRQSQSANYWFLSASSAFFVNKLSQDWWIFIWSGVACQRQFTKPFHIILFEIKTDLFQLECLWNKCRSICSFLTQKLSLRQTSNTQLIIINQRKYFTIVIIFVSETLSLTVENEEEKTSLERPQLVRNSRNN